MATLRALEIEGDADGITLANLIELDSTEARMLALDILNRIGYRAYNERMIPHILIHSETTRCDAVHYESFGNFMDYQDLDSIDMYKFGVDVVYRTEDPNECDAYYGHDDHSITFVVKP